MSLLHQKCFSDSVNVVVVAVLWVVAIIGVCYDVTKVIEASGVHVYYEYGCYTITAAGRKLIQSDSCYKCMVKATAGVAEAWNVIMRLLCYISFAG
jgi:cbb3-type cytochrome oxidase cytochrome c subunit